MLPRETTEQYDYLMRHWKSNIHSDEGLFKKKENERNAIIGPKFSPLLTGSAFVTESVVFGRIATPQQHQFMEYLVDRDVIKLRQYVAVITGAERVWKEDINTLQETIRHLKGAKDLFKEEEKDVTRDDVTRLQRLKVLLRGVLDSKELEEMIHNFEEFLNKLKQQQEKLNSHLALFEVKFKELRANYPFLF